MYSPVDYKPTEFAYFGASTAGDFTSFGVITVLTQPSQVEIVDPYTVKIKSGSCPTSYNAAQSTKGLGAFVLTAPQGYNLNYTEKSGYREIDWKNACSDYKWGGEGQIKTLGPGESVTIRAQRAGSNKMWGKIVSLKSMEPVGSGGGNGGGNGGGGGGVTSILPIVVLGVVGVGSAVAIGVLLKKRK